MVKLCLAWDVGSVSLSCLRASALPGRHYVATECLHSTYHGWGQVPDWVSWVLLLCRWVNRNDREMWGFPVGRGRKEWGTSTLKLLLFIISIAILPAGCLEGHGLCRARYMHTAKAEPEKRSSPTEASCWRPLRAGIQGLECKARGAAAAKNHTQAVSAPGVCPNTCCYYFYILVHHYLATTFSNWYFLMCA